MLIARHFKNEFWEPDVYHPPHQKSSPFFLKKHKTQRNTTCNSLITGLKEERDGKILSQAPSENSLTTNLDH